MVACFATLCLVSIAAANQSSAQPSNKQEIEARFNAADTNGDGQITLAEAQAGMPRVAMAWDKIDVDKKGYITLDQLLAIVAANQ
jgi:Ca2+-binding EF-hand superfamily protein